ncbi:MAG: hypothetical protein PHP50_00460 [Lachnospiraceae bacterium]|nr:hypothetical protein [Lachnospiraceae bacterium]
MATQITNQATLNYTSGSNNLSTISNTATVTLQGPLEVTKYSLENAYRIGEDITYNVFITNSSANSLTGVTVEDDLGTYAIGQTTNVTPLTYTGPAKLFINNTFSGTIQGVVSADADSVTFTLGTIAPGSSALLQYQATVNNYAGAIVGTSDIDNIVSVTAAGVTTPIIATNSIPVAAYADVTIEKNMSPDPVVDGSTLTYTFVIRNYGTIAATNVSLQDIFTTFPNITSVTVDGVATTEYSYSAGTFLYPSASSGINYTIPAATFTQDPATGLYTIVPGTSTVIIQGTI